MTLLSSDAWPCPLGPMACWATKASQTAHSVLEKAFHPFFSSFLLSISPSLSCLERHFRWHFPLQSFILQSAAQFHCWMVSLKEPKCARASARDSFSQWPIIVTNSPFKSCWNLMLHTILLENNCHRSWALLPFQSCWNMLAVRFPDKWALMKMWITKQPRTMDLLAHWAYICLIHILLQRKWYSRILYSLCCFKHVMYFKFFIQVTLSSNDEKQRSLILKS